MRLSCCAGLASFVPPTADAKQLDTSEIYRSKLEKAPAVLKTLVDAGCDFFEFGVGMLCPEAPKSLFEEFKTLLDSYPLRAECFNSFIPSDLKVTGPNVDVGRLTNYIAQATRRAAELDGRIIVFGSGGARTVPEGFSRHRAHEQILEFLAIAAEHAQSRGIIIAIEPLNRSETNLINSIAEAVQYADEIARPEIQVLVDFYHLMVEGESFDQIVNAGDRIAHVHVADTDRLYPGSGQYDYQGFAQCLADAGYSKRVSVECNFRDFDQDVSQSIRFLQPVFKAS
ncbi:MAG: sugar phosphate isomerase/epimerase [Candidatus Poribacteria bacterium]|nr:sugar phosphate isomerase/epimerase [Candidatus Poribacteria bacterium]